MSRKPKLTPAVADTLETYRPVGLRDEELEILDAVLPTARSWVAAAAPRTPKTARSLLWAAVRIALWAYDELRSLDPALVLDPHNVEHFVMHVNKTQSAAWRHVARSALSRVGQAANPNGWPPPRPRAGRSIPPAPYEPHQERGFVVEAQLPGRPHRTGRLWVTSGGLGAGLPGSELREARVEDLVDMRGDRVGIWVHGDNARLVPVRTHYTSLVREAADEAGTGKFVTAKGDNSVHSIAERLTPEGLSLPRARATWLVAHLSMTPALALQAMSDVSLDTLNALAKRAGASLSPEEAAELGLGP